MLSTVDLRRRLDSQEGKTTGLFPGKLESCSYVVRIRDHDFLMSQSAIFVPGGEHVPTRRDIGDRKPAALVGHGKIRIVKYMDVSEHPRMCVANDFEHPWLRESSCDVEARTFKR